MVQATRLASALLLSLSLSGPAGAAEQEALQIVVSKASQSLKVYKGLEVIATSRVSTGKAGHGTPAGIFSILEKRRYHESNLYDSAPMPYMQRITWSGFALHESGHVPRYPASHGCVRMPGDFARSLFGMTAPGEPVIITDRETDPVPTSHALLFRPQPASPPGLLLSDVALRGEDTLPEGNRPVELAANRTSAAPVPAALLPEAAEEPPLRILVTRRTDRDLVRWTQEALARLGFDIGAPDGVIGEKTLAALKIFRAENDIRNTGATLTPDLLSALAAYTRMAPLPNGMLSIRQGFKPIFDAPIALKAPERALGTHFLSLARLDRSRGTADWTAITLPDRLPPKTARRLGITEPEAGDDLAAVLDRIDIPSDIRAHIEGRISLGSSITVTDQVDISETGKGTDFIVTTRPPKA